MLTKLHIPKPKEFLDQFFKAQNNERGTSSRHLVSFYISGDLLSQIESQLQEVIG